MLASVFVMFIEMSHIAAEHLFISIGNFIYLTIYILFICCSSKYHFIFRFGYNILPVVDLNNYHARWYTVMMLRVCYCRA